MVVGCPEAIGTVEEAALEGPHEDAHSCLGPVLVHVWHRLCLRPLTSICFTNVQKTAPGGDINTADFH